MKKLLLLLLTSVPLFAQIQPQSAPQGLINGWIFVNAYVNWSVPMGDGGSTSWPNPSFCTAASGGTTFPAFTLGSPIEIIDQNNPTLNEVVTVTQVNKTQGSCAISTTTPVHQHSQYQFTTSTAGLQEALNANIGITYPTAVVITGDYFANGGTLAQITTTIKGTANLNIVDTTKAPTVWYAWSGSHYVAVTIGGTAGNLGTLQGDLLVNNQFNTSAIDANVFIADEPTVNANGLTPQQAINAAAAHGGSVILQPNIGTNTPFTNASGVKVVDLAAVQAQARSVMEFGAQCNARGAFMTMVSGSNVVTIYADFFYVADIGKTLAAVGLVGSLQTAFEPTITAMGIGVGPGYSTAFMSANAPFTIASPVRVPLGNDDTAAINQAFITAATPLATNTGSSTSLSFPASACWSHTTTYTGVSFFGVDRVNSQWLNFPGEDTLLAPDPSVSSPVQGNGVGWFNLAPQVDHRIDATQPWQIINTSGTTAKAALYRPSCILCATSNNPKGPGWFQGASPNNSGAYNGVAAVVGASATITIPVGVNLPVATNTIVFPYLPTVFTTTVLSVNSGARTALLNTVYPGSNANQAEWFAGTSVQRLSVSVGSGACPATVTLTNPITPSPSTETNVAPFGLIQIDGEQMSYFGKTNAGNLGSQYLTITACALNGTARAAHSVNATVVPLNQYLPAIPWPVTPTINSGGTTPAAAAYYPAWNVGNTFFAAPVANGATGTFGVGSFANAVIDGLTINADFPDSFPANNTAPFYFVSLPYSTTFNDLTMSGQYGPQEAAPAFNSGAGWTSAQPTADGTRWNNIRVNACNVSNLITGGTNVYTAWNSYSQCYNQTTASYTGAQTCNYFTQGWNDQTGTALSVSGITTLTGIYCEPESGSLYGQVPIYEFDINGAVWTSMHMGGGGETYLGGQNQRWIGGNFNNQAVFPILNYGTGNGSDYGTLLTNGPVGNVYGVNSLINFAPNVSFSGTTNQPGGSATGPFGANQQGNSREPWHGQSNETFNTGNITAPYVNSNGGFIPAGEFNCSFSYEANPFSCWNYDNTLLPSGDPAGGSVRCNISTTGSAVCFSFQFNQQGVAIGPGQRLAAGKYTFRVASKSTGLATSYGIKIGGCTLGDTASITVPVSTSYSIYEDPVPVDFTAAIAGCAGQLGTLSLDFIYAAPSNDTISVAWVDFAPVQQEINATTINVTNINTPSSPTGGSPNGCSQSPVVGIQGGFTCPTKGWLALLAANQGSGDSTITLSSTSGLSAAGCFFVNSEYECYTGISGSTLTGLSRGAYLTTAATHNTGASVVSVNLVLGSVQQMPSSILAYGSPVILTTNDPLPPNHAGLSVFSANQGNSEFWIDSGGGIHNQNTAATSSLLGPLNVGTYPNSSSITDSGQLMQVNIPATAYSPMTLGGGHAGSLNVIQTPTIGAPSILVSATPASSTISYVCSGTDFDGNLIPGTTATITNGAASWAFPVGYQVECPYVAGVNTYQIYRTAGGPSQGLLASGVGPAFLVHDYGGAASGGTPPSSNASNPHISVAGPGNAVITMGSTTITAAAGAPSTTCGTAPNGSGSLWMRTDGAASTSLYSCGGTTWTAVTVP